MGPVPMYSEPPPTRPATKGFNLREYRKAKRLRWLLDELTPVEEAAIRQIAPLMHVTRISHGSMRVKGNTSCVWQQSKWHTVLPNTPPNIHYIYIVRNPHSTRPALRSSRCRRYYIQEVLELEHISLDDPLLLFRVTCFFYYFI